MEREIYRLIDDYYKCDINHLKEIIFYDIIFLVGAYFISLKSNS